MQDNMGVFDGGQFVKGCSHRSIQEHRLQASSAVMARAVIFCWRF
jgi:hypothetical protein